MSHENPAFAYPEKFPSNIQWGSLLAEPNEVLHEEFEPQERVVFEYIAWMADALGPDLPGQDIKEISQVDEAQAMYRLIGVEDFLHPSQMLFSLHRTEEDAAGKGFLEFTLDMSGRADEKTVSVVIKTQKIPSPFDESGYEEVLGDYEMTFSVKGAHVYGIDSIEDQVDEEMVHLFGATLTRLKRSLESDYEIEHTD